MILPTKRITENRALLTIGGNVLSELTEPKSVSQLWDDVSRRTRDALAGPHLGFDWFILALDLLYTLGAIEYHRGRLSKSGRQ